MIFILPYVSPNVPGTTNLKPACWLRLPVAAGCAVAARVGTLGPFSELFCYQSRVLYTDSDSP